MEPRPPEDENTPVRRKRWRPLDSPERNTMSETAALAANLEMVGPDPLLLNGWS